MTNYGKIKDRVKLIVDRTGMTNNEFAKSAGIEPSNFRKMLKGELTITKKTIYKICERFGVNKNWLENGEDSVTPNIIQDISDGVPFIAEEVKSTGQPYYDVDFLGGFDIMYNNQNAVPSGYVNLPIYNRSGIIWCNITGHSMEPMINHGDIIAIKELEDWQTYMPKGEIYGIVTSNGLRTVKIVRKGSDDKHIKLIPVNTQDFDEEEIPISMIMRVFMVIANIKKF